MIAGITADLVAYCKHFARAHITSSPSIEIRISIRRAMLIASGTGGQLDLSLGGLLAFKWRHYWPVDGRRPSECHSLLWKRVALLNQASCVFLVCTDVGLRATMSSNAAAHEL